MSTAVSSSQKIERANRERDPSATMRELLGLKTALRAHAVVVMAGPEERIASASEKFSALSKYTRKELIGCDQRGIDCGFQQKAFFRALRSIGATLSIVSKRSGGTSIRTHLLA